VGILEWGWVKVMIVMSLQSHSGQVTSDVR